MPMPITAPDCFYWSYSKALIIDVVDLTEFSSSVTHPEYVYFSGECKTDLGKCILKVVAKLEECEKKKKMSFPGTLNYFAI